MIVDKLDGQKPALYMIGGLDAEIFFLIFFFL